MGLFEHFPYVNLHELNLDWILLKLKQNTEDAASSAEDAAASAEDAAAAATNAAEAVSQAAAAQESATEALTTAQSANTTANAALTAANKTVITVNCDAANNTGEIDSDLTFDQIIEAAQQNNILVRLSISTDSDDVYRQLIYPTLQYSQVSDYWSLTAELIRADGTGTVAPSRIYIEKAIFINSKTGYYQTAQILV